MSEVLAIHIIKTLQEHGHDAYLVGGCVRDRRLGLVPKDFDVATSAVPDRIVELFPCADLVGKSFGVLIIKHPDHQSSVEVATFRRDGQYSDGRRPDTVEFSDSAYVDSTRRDFTVNALYEDPLAGEVLDFHGGLEDLEDKRIRCVGDAYARFSEDYLRMLRAVRFAARFQFAIEAKTAKAIAENAYQVYYLAQERIAGELNRILLGPNPSVAFDLMRQTGMLHHIMEEVVQMFGCAQPPQYHPEGDVWRHTMLMLEQAQPKHSLPLSLAALFHDMGKRACLGINEHGLITFKDHADLSASQADWYLSHLRYSNEIREQAVWAVANHMRINEIDKMRRGKQLRFIREPHFPLLLDLHYLDCVCSNGDLSSYQFALKLLQETPPEVLRPPRLITGDDLLALGLDAGPEIGRLLKLVEEHQLDGKIATAEEALDLIRKENALA